MLHKHEDETLKCVKYWQTNPASQLKKLINTMPQPIEL